MIKTLRVLSLIGLAMVGMTVKAELGALIDPVRAIDSLGSIFQKPKNMVCLASAACLSLLADSFARREFDDKGGYRTIETEDCDPAIGNAIYCLAQGVGYAGVNQWLCEQEDMTFKDGVTNSMVCAAAYFVTEKVRNTGVFDGLSRNNALLRWVPFNVKLDKSVVDSILCIAATRAFNRYVVPVLTSK